MALLSLDPDPKAAHYVDTGVWGRVTLDALFKRNLVRTPDRIALADTADRAGWSGRPPVRLTYRQADAAIAALACRFQELGLRPGSVVAVQLPNSVEWPLTLLACQRAGLVPAVVPFLWRSRDIARALEPLTPKAIVTVTKAGEDAPADLLRYAAAELFSVRFVMAFGADIPDGVMSLDDTLTPVSAREPRAVPAEPGANPGEAPALVTFRTTAAGHAAVVRANNHWVSAGLATVLEARMEPGEVIVSTAQPGSFLSLAATLMPWLLTGGTLITHQAYDAAAFAGALAAERATRVVVPGPLLAEVMPAIATASTTVKSAIALFPDARRLAGRATLAGGPDIVDVAALDEWGLVARRRRNGEPRALPSGAIRQPTDGQAGPVLVETRLLPSGRLAVRGPMVPYDANAEDGFRTTGLSVAEAGGLLAIKGRTDGVAFVGGLAAGRDEIADILIGAPEADAVKITALPDPLFGERIEAHVAPRLDAPVDEGVMIDRLYAHLAGAGVSGHKVPSRIVVDHHVRSDAQARLKGTAAGGR